MFRRTDQSHDDAVVGIADMPATEGFAHVAIDVDGFDTHHSPATCVFSGQFLRCRFLGQPSVGGRSGVE